MSVAYRTRVLLVGLTFVLTAGLGASRAGLDDLTGDDDAIRSLLTRYQGGEFQSAVLPLTAEADETRLRARFTAVADRWIADADLDIGSRRFAAAAMALEIVEARLFRDSTPTLSGYVEWAETHATRFGPSARERTWTLAAVSLLHAMRAPFGHAFVDRAVRRFPRDPEVRFAAVQWWYVGISNPDRVAGPTPSPAPPTPSDLDELVRDPRVAGEVSLYLAYRAYHEYGGSRANRRAAIGHAETALRHTLEPGSRYIAHLLAAWSYEANDALDDAFRSYEAALREHPHGQTASLGLAALFLRTNRVSDARALVARSLHERAVERDPWHWFSYGAYRHWPTLVAKLRTEVRP